MAIAAANVVISTDSFSDWITKFNNVAYYITTSVITANSTLGVTSGNAYLNGIFSANTLAATQTLRGGNNTTTAALSFGSNVSILNNYFIAGNTATSSLNVANVVLGTTTANQVLDTYSLSTGRTSKYLIQVSNTTAYQSTELLVTHDGVNSYVTEYATLTSAGTIASFGSNTASGNLNILISPATTCNVIFERTVLSL